MRFIFASHTRISCSITNATLRNLTRFQAISMYWKLARLQQIKREEYPTVKVCNFVFLCVGSNLYRYIYLSILLYCKGQKHTIVCSFHFGDDNFRSIVLYCLLIVVGSFCKRAASPQSLFKCPVDKPHLIPKIQNKIKLNRNLIRGKPNMVNTTGVRCVLSQMMLSDTAYTNSTLKFLN